MRTLRWTLLTVGCAGPPAPPAPPAARPRAAAPDAQLDGDGGVARDPVEQLQRASMALRGLRPSLDELARVQADPDALPELVDGWLRSEAFAATVRDQHAEQLRLRTDLFETLPAVDALAGVPTAQIVASVQEAPLHLISDVVISGRPYSEILTSATLRADATAAAVWGYADYDPDRGGWQEVTVPADRPAMGILSDAGLWFRHPSNGANYGRGRADLVAEALLCAGFSGRDIPLTGGLDLSDDEAVAEAVRTDPGCVACHQALDPLAAHLWPWVGRISSAGVLLAYAGGCAEPIGALCYPMNPWIPALGTAIERTGLRAPGYWGLEGEEVGLGDAIAADPRFATCAARRVAGWLGRTAPADVPLETVAELVAVYGATGGDLRAVAKQVVLGAPFTHLELPEGDDRPPVGRQVLRPEAAARLIEDLTGFVWRGDADALSPCPATGCIGPTALLTSDQLGFRTMAGGMDGYRVTLPTAAPTPTQALTYAAWAAHAAAHVVQVDLVDGEGRLLDRVGPDTRDEAAVRAQLQRLQARVLGQVVATDSEEVDELWSLFALALDGRDDPAEAWGVVLTALFQDPALLTW